MGEGGLNLIDMWGTMTWVAKGVAFILVIMSMWSFGVAIERIYTFTQARNQSKAVCAAGGQAPQGRAG